MKKDTTKNGTAYPRLCVCAMMVTGKGWLCEIRGASPACQPEAALWKPDSTNSDFRHGWIWGISNLIAHNRRCFLSIIVTS